MVDLRTQDGRVPQDYHFGNRLRLGNKFRDYKKRGLGPKLPNVTIGPIESLLTSTITKVGNLQRVRGHTDV